MVRACADNPARARRTPDCINARAAEMAESIGSVQDLPPMLNGPDKNIGKPEKGEEGR